jgi:hypothetical protein
MPLKKTSEQIVREYEQESEIILQKMMKILLRTQRKVDDTTYHKILNSLDKEK